MSNENILTSTHGPDTRQVGIITLNRPKQLNAWQALRLWIRAHTTLGSSNCSRPSNSSGTAAPSCSS